MIRPAAAVTAAALSLFLIAGCSPPTPGDKTGQLLSMAAQEAASIPSTVERFTRQLNIAETQIQTNRRTDAQRTLALARQTLEDSKDEAFDSFHRIAGWTSISQLSRQAGDRNLAMISSDFALAALNDVKPAQDRALYVISLAGELEELRGKQDAVELLISGGAWAAEIPDPNVRRHAFVAFTNRLLAYEAFEGARTTLRRDPDPRWRTDTFLALANNASPFPGEELGSQVQVMRRAVGGGRGGAAGTPTPAEDRTPTAHRPQAPSAEFGKDVRYESVFQQQR